MSKAGVFLKHFFSKDAEPGNVPNLELMNYSVGLAGQNLHYNYINGWLSYFYNTILGVNPSKVGSLFFVTHLWDAVNDPLIGGIVDRRRFKSGEKLRPFLLYLPPIIGAVSALMFLGIPFSTDFGKLAYLTVIYLIWDLLYSVQDVALWGMVAVASPNSDERGRVAQWVSIGAGAGSAVGGAFSMLWSICSGAGLSDKATFTLFGFLFGLGGQLISMHAHKIQERVRSTNTEQESFGETIRLLFKNKKLMLVSLARIVANLYPQVNGIYFFKNCMEVKVGSVTLSGTTLYTLVPLLGGIPGAAAMFFANKFAIRVGGMKRLLFLAKAMELCCRVLSFLLGMGGKYNVVWRLAIIILLTGLQSIPTSMMDIAHRALTSDGIDEVEVETGERSEGVAFSTQNFVSKLNSGISRLIEGFLLTKLGYDNSSENAVQSELFKKWQWPLYILGPAIGAAFYLIAISFINDDRAHQAEITAILEERRKAAQTEGV
ncbi:MAG: MFS transporter [Clostridia bacterium]|nr:MFS transporter [Clostridia bacterium]